VSQAEGARDGEAGGVLAMRCLKGLPEHDAKGDIAFWLGGLRSVGLRRHIPIRAVQPAGTLFPKTVPTVALLLM
jgi:hypothetical protein